MCVTAVLAAVAVVAGGIGTYASLQAASAQKRQAKYESRVREKQLNNEREMARIEALQRENIRSDEFQRARSSAMAAIGASGLGEHISFFQSIDPEAQKAWLRDVRSIRLNLAAKEVSIADQVNVTEYRKDISVFNASLSQVGAIADFIKTAASAASMYAQGAVGAPGGGDPSGGAWTGTSFGSNPPTGAMGM